MSRSYSFHVKSSFWVWPLLFFAASFLYILWRLEPALYYQCQVPAFLWEDTFFHRFLVFPGGLAEYASHLLSQFYYFPLLGAVMITASMFFTFWLTRAILKHLAPAWRDSLLAYIPAILVLVLFSQYEHRLTYTIGWLLSLGGVVLYLKWQSKSVLIRLAVFLFLSAFLYYTTAGFFLFFTTCALLLELFNRRWMLAIAYLAVSAGIPILAQSIFVLTTKSAYFYLILPIYQYKPIFTPYLLYVYFPLMFIAARTGVLEKFSRYTQGLYAKLSFVLVFVLALVAALISFDAAMRTVLKVDYYAHNREWQPLLNYVQKHPSDDVLVVFQTNRALYHTGHLSSDMFTYNQQWGLNGLFLPEEARKFFSIQISDLYWDMGLLNEAQHWILEDHTNFSYGPWHLQRLAEINILRGNKSLANMCLDALDKSILYRNWAQQHRKYLEHPELVEKNSHLAYIKSQHVTDDFLISPSRPEQDIFRFAMQNQQNPMAMEYLLADYMLTFRLGLFVHTLETSGMLQRSLLPRHYQEALVIFLQNTGWRQKDELRRNISSKTLADFEKFFHILEGYDGDAAAAQQELRKQYGDTYWYFSLYNNPNARQVSSTN